MMTLQELINQINYHRTKLNLSPIFIRSRPSSSGNGKTLEIRCGKEGSVIESTLLSKSTHAGSLNWFLKGVLTAFQNDAAPSISGFNQQLAAITRSNYTRIVEED